jgi:hypothetical protein
MAKTVLHKEMIIKEIVTFLRNKTGKYVFLRMAIVAKIANFIPTNEFFFDIMLTQVESPFFFG